MLDAQELLTVQDVAREWKVHRETVYSLVNARPPKLASVRIGSGKGRIRITRRAVDDYLKRVSSGSLTSEPPANAKHWRTRFNSLYEE